MYQAKVDAVTATHASVRTPSGKIITIAKDQFYPGHEFAMNDLRRYLQPGDVVCFDIMNETADSPQARDVRFPRSRLDENCTHPRGWGIVETQTPERAVVWSPEFDYVELLRATVPGPAFVRNPRYWPDTTTPGMRILFKMEMWTYAGNPHTTYCFKSFRPKDIEDVFGLSSPFVPKLPSHFLSSASGAGNAGTSSGSAGSSVGPSQAGTSGASAFVLRGPGQAGAARASATAPLPRGVASGAPGVSGLPAPRVGFGRGRGPPVSHRLVALRSPPISASSAAASSSSGSQPPLDPNVHRGLICTVLPNKLGIFCPQIGQVEFCLNWPPAPLEQIYRQFQTVEVKIDLNSLPNPRDVTLANAIRVVKALFNVYDNATGAVLKYVNAVCESCSAGAAILRVQEPPLADHQIYCAPAACPSLSRQVERLPLPGDSCRVLVCELPAWAPSRAAHCRWQALLVYSVPFERYELNDLNLYNFNFSRIPISLAAGSWRAAN